MDNIAIRAGKWVFSGIMSLWGLIIPIHILIYCTIIAICIDFITGNIADYYRNKRAGKKYAFESEKMWKTIWKLSLAIVGIGFAWMLDSHVLSHMDSLHLANFFAAFVTGAEFWSFCENAAVISDHPIFRILGKYMKEDIQRKTNINYGNEK